jgi:hypothetical protein
VSLAELDDLLCNEGEVAHVAKTNLLGALGFVAALLAFDDRGGDATSIEDINGKSPVVAALHGAIENLLDYIVDNIVKEVVPWEAEEESLAQLVLYIVSKEQEILTRIVGTTLFSTNIIFK